MWASRIGKILKHMHTNTETLYFMNYVGHAVGLVYFFLLGRGLQDYKDAFI